MEKCNYLYGSLMFNGCKLLVITRGEPQDGRIWHSGPHSAGSPCRKRATPRASRAAASANASSLDCPASVEQGRRLSDAMEE